MSDPLRQICCDFALKCYEIVLLSRSSRGSSFSPSSSSQLSGAVIAAVVEGSEVTASEYALTSWLNIVGGATPTELAHGSRPVADDALGHDRPPRPQEAGAAGSASRGRALVPARADRGGQEDERAERPAVLRGVQSCTASSRAIRRRSCRDAPARGRAAGACSEGSILGKRSGARGGRRFIHLGWGGG